MDIIFWRHAEACEAAADQADDDRPLTQKGHRQARRMGRWLDKHLPGQCRILVSPALRAVETASHLGRPYIVEPGIGTQARGRGLLQVARKGSGHDECVLLVGHQPSLGQAVMELLAGPIGRSCELSIRKGGVWWLATKGPVGGTAAVVAVRNPDGP